MKYLTIALYHPRVMKGGAQYVAKDLHDMAHADPSVEAVLLAGIDGRMFPQYGKVGSAITLLPDSESEFVMPGTRFNDFYHVVYDHRRTKAFVRFLLDHRPDVIHLHHSLWVGLDAIDIIRKILPNCCIIYTLHEYMPICYSRGQLYRYHESAICQDTSPDQCVKCFPDRTADDFFLRRRKFLRAFSMVDHFVAPSDYLRRRYVDWGVPEQKISVIPNGHRSCRSGDWEPKHSTALNVFGFFGQYVDAKGIDVLLAAAVLAADRVSGIIELNIYGGNKEYASEEYRRKIESISSRAPANLRVNELGAYSRENVFSLMSSVDWVVMPSVWPETFGLVVSEAWDARRPVISSSAGGLGERIVSGKNGLTFDPGSVTQLADYIQRCVGNAALWSELSAGIVDEISLEDSWLAHRKLSEALVEKRNLELLTSL